jgi:hypothetical protein
MSNEPNLDLIAMVQRARLAHDANATPSQVAAVYWIEVKRMGEGAAPTPRAGQYIIKTTVDAVDALWATIKAATERGDLGYKSKVSTASRRGQPNERLIYVLTYDADDTADVERVGAALRALVNTEIRYERVTG